MTDHLITPPPELLAQWIEEWINVHGPDKEGIDYVVAQAARWGADQELEACLAEVSFFSRRGLAGKIRNIRRPRPLSLKEQALHELGDVYDNGKIDDTTYDTIRRALEALDD